MKNHPVIGNLIIMGIGLFVGVILGEVVVRVFKPQELIKPCYISDPELALAGMPHCSFTDNWHEEYFTYEVSFNNLGYRMAEDITAPHTNRVACLGDSYSYGWGVAIEDAFYGLLDTQLKKEAASVQLVNTSFPSYSTGHCTKALERLDDQFPVKKAIYFMFYNDVFDNLRNDANYISHTFEMNQDGEVSLSPVTRKKPSTAKKIREWLYKRSHLVMLIRKSMPDFKDGHSHSGPRTEDQLTEEQIATMQAVTLAHLNNLSQKCKARNIDLQIVWIPCWDALQLENDYAWQNHFPFDALITQMETAFHFYDPTEDLNQLLRLENKKLSDYYFGEGHFTEEGNRLFYEAINEQVEGFIKDGL